MPRKRRIMFPNAWYHAMNRGAARRYLLQSDEHKSQFMLLLYLKIKEIAAFVDDTITPH